ncbi:multidrug efflux pump subunit AcrA (membrane-fusion protein) [Actinoplanes tereljensis]|uniref:Uncharacterized protein n=1 Tax=Paractinoplanes tereljensis TaxID=571912 RepID=A0A919NVF2_9ACTN|nr:hypothetical protein [Actinoplanes tereljensis]GIF24686.1 hypothetical protein Ate02nite_74160 [Actinoplanes tereljensis]
MNDQYKARLSAVEQRVEFEAGLRAKVDRDLADLQSGQQGMLKVVNALRETQVEQGQAIGRIESRMDKFEATQNLHTAALNHHSAILTEMVQLAVEQKRRTDQLDAKVGQLSTQMVRVLELLEPPHAPRIAAAC